MGVARRSVEWAALMRSLYFLPITFLAGQHGFLFFAPYLALFLASVHLLRVRRGRLAILALTPGATPLG
jgi:hypothetical protein